MNQDERKRERETDVTKPSPLLLSKLAEAKFSLVTCVQQISPFFSDFLLAFCHLFQLFNERINNVLFTLYYYYYQQVPQHKVVPDILSFANLEQQNKVVFLSRSPVYLSFLCIFFKYLIDIVTSISLFPYASILLTLAFSCFFSASLIPIMIGYCRNTLYPNSVQ